MEPQATDQNTLEYQAQLNSIVTKVHEAESFVKVLPVVEKEMLAMLKAERLTVYQRGRHDREIVSKYKTGKDIKEIRVPLSPASIAGYVAMSQKPVRIDNVYDKNALRSIHPQTVESVYTTHSRIGQRPGITEGRLRLEELIRHVRHVAAASWQVAVDRTMEGDTNWNRHP